MKDSIFHCIYTNNKRTGGGDPSSPTSVSPSNCKKPKHITELALINLQFFDVPLISRGGSPLHAICLQPDRLYTIGRWRTNSDCHFLFKDSRVSKEHCQILFDSVQRKIYIIDGSVLLHGVSASCIVSEFRRRLLCADQLEGEEKEVMECFRAKVSLNGVFVNGIKLERGTVRELCSRDEVLLACGNECLRNLDVRVGIVIQGVLFKEEVVMSSIEIQLERIGFFETTTSVGHSQGSVSSGNRNKRVFAIHANEIMSSIDDYPRVKSVGIVRKARSLSSRCRKILHSDDPISYIRQCGLTDFRMDITDACDSKLNSYSDLTDIRRTSTRYEPQGKTDALIFHEEAQHCQNSKIDPVIVNSNENGKHDPLLGDAQMKTWKNYLQPPGKKFYLNRLHFMDYGSSGHQNVVALPELLHPIGSILRIFIATFTSDILWFLSSCEIPRHLPVTIACHNTERCWSSSPDKRISMPYSDFPNLVVVSPPFPESIAFGNDRKRQGIACHHPKLFVLQREDSIRVIITSANLVANQWNNVTNTIWWQDFPPRCTPDLSSLFIQLSGGEINPDSKSDFAAQLAGFIASLVVDVPSQAYWIMELAKYNFEGAMGYLVASVPGIHSCRTSCAYQYASESTDMKFVGLVEASVVGLSHLFHTAADTNGALLKRLAAFLGRSHGNACGMSKIFLRRNTNIPADVNAVSILVPNPDQSSGDCVQLGFLPRDVAKWVSPLWDSGFFRFSGFVHPKEALAAALGETNKRVQLILHVSQAWGLTFQI